jgi:hypothetical protein
MISFTDPHTNQIVEFLVEIGLRVEPGELTGKTTLPGIAIRTGTLIIDEARLLYPGDLLHEAGHLAVLPADARDQADAQLLSNGGEEMAAIAWSYAAALHIGLEPEVVFHSNGYKQGSNALLENFRAGRYIAVPLLQWMGLAVESKNAEARGVAPFPHMLRWLRE